MKRLRIVMLCGWLLTAGMLQAQTKIDDKKMERDIEVAENVLSTLIRQQFTKRNFFPFDVEAAYASGYGVTFRIPSEFPGPMIFSLSGEPKIAYGFNQVGTTYSYVVSSDSDDEDDENCDDCERQGGEDKKDKNHKNEKGKRNSAQNRVRHGNLDSLTNVFSQRIIEASKEFIADYGDLISQLAPDERIKITNRHEGQRYWYSGDNARRRFISLECLRGDISQFKQGKITRDQLMSKISVVDSESSEEVSPDLELLSTMFNRIYQPDLSKTFYVQDEVYYERLKNYGVVFYLHVYSSNQIDLKRYDMPTVNLERVDKETRDKKVKELYPLFEKDVKESMLDYGRTLKSLKDNEVLVLNVQLTQCEACAIPSSLELSVKSSVLKDYSSGKLTKDAAAALIAVKKGPNQ